MSYSSDEYVVAHEFLYPEGQWVAMLTASTGSQDQARREYSRLKANEIVYPERYRGIRLLRRTTTVSSWQDIAG